MFWDYRNPSDKRGRSVDGVATRAVADDYVDALLKAHSVLTGSDCKWPDTRGGATRVYIGALQAGEFGWAIPDENVVLLPCSGSEPQVAWARIRRQASAAHELTHLFLPEIRSAAKWGWRAFAEAVCVAMESVVFPGNADHFRFLIPWITAPEETLAIEISEDRARSAAPFITYLMRRFGCGILHEIYEVALRHSDDDPLWPLDAIDLVLRRHDAVLADTSVDEDVFGSGYCVDAYFLTDVNSGLHNLALFNRHGQRAVTETFSTRPPVRAAAGSDPVSHLGCRYFRFRPEAGKPTLNVSVALPNEGAKAYLRGELIRVMEDGTMGIKRARLLRTDSGDEMAGEMAELDEPGIDHVVLVVANCAWGKPAEGAPDRDGITFTVSAEAS